MIASTSYTVSAETQLVTLSPGVGYSFVLNAVWQPSYGELVKIIEVPETGPDRYMVCIPHGVTEVKAILEQIPFYWLWRSRHFPFLTRGKEVFGDIAGAEMCIFSLTEVENFLEH